MKQSRTAIRELTAAYRAVLKHAFIASMGIIIAVPAMAADILDVQYTNTAEEGIIKYLDDDKETNIITELKNNSSEQAVVLVGLEHTVTVAENAEISGNSNTNGGVGGAFYLNKPSTDQAGGKLIVQNGAKFSNNTSIYDGGAIGNYGTLDVTGAVFDGNSSQMSGDTDWRPIGGGAISLGVDSHTTVKNTVFSGNTSGYNGGAIGMRRTIEKTETGQNNSLIISDSRFVKNSATGTVTDIDNDKQPGGNGGAIANTFDTTEIINTEFIENYAKSRGGAIYNAKFYDLVAGAISENYGGTIKVADTKFTGNTAAVGGAIYNDGTMTIDGTQFVGNTVDNNENSFGGAIYNAGTMNISGTSFSENRAETAGYGGAIFNASGLLTIDNAVFSNNSASWDGGAISSMSSFINSKKLPADWNQGEYSVENVRKYWESKNGFDAANKIVITNSTFENNTVDTYSGGALGIYSDADIKNSNFVGNNAGGHNPADAVDGGGAIYAGGWARIDIANAKFSENSSNYGGAIATTRAGLTDDTYLKINGTQFENNAATVSGGAIANKFEDTTITDTVFTGNTAAVSGGAIYNIAKIAFNGTNVFSDNMAGDVANDIHNLGTMTIASGTTTIGGGITGTGTFNIAENATLDLGTSALEQNVLQLDGTLSMIIADADAFGTLNVTDITVGENGKLALNIKNAGEYKLFLADTIDDANIIAGGGIYSMTAKGEGTYEFAVKQANDIATDTGLSGVSSNTLAALASSNDEKATAIAIVAQQELAAGNTDYVETETAKLSSDDKPVAHSVSTSVQNQVLALAAGRMSGGMSVGRSGGDFANADYGVWAQGLFNKSKLNGQFHGYTRGVAVGADTLINNTYTLGIGYSFNSTDVHANLRDTDIESNSVFLYGQYKPADWYINAALNYTMSDYTEHTTSFGIGIESNYDVDSFGGQVMTGYDFASGITPEVGVRYLHISQDDYSNGLAGIKVGDTDFMTGVAGVKYGFAIETNSAFKLRPELRAAATYDFLSDEAIATVTMPNAPAYIVGSDRLSRMGGEFGIGLTAEYKGLEVSLNYDLDLHEDYTSQTGMLKFKYNF